jgi:hypothetical protein
MSDENLFLDSQHSTSRRFAVYLIEPDSRKPVADAWVYNRIPAPSTKEILSYRGGPAPAAIGYTSDEALCETPKSHTWSFVWSTDGESVAIAKKTMACSGRRYRDAANS